MNVSTAKSALEVMDNQGVTFEGGGTHITKYADNRNIVMRDQQMLAK